MTKKCKIATYIICTTLVSAILIVLIIVFSSNINGWYNLSNPYLFGGVLSGVFSGLAFIGVILTLFFQREDSKSIKIEKFETTLFNMLSLQQEIVSELYLKVKNKEKLYEEAPNWGTISKEYIDVDEIRGRELFRYSFESAEHYINNTGTSGTVEGIEVKVLFLLFSKHLRPLWWKD